MVAGIPKMEIGLAYILGMVLREHGLTRTAFDRLPDEEQEDLIAHYIAGQKIQAWQAYRDWKQLQTKPGS